jgi:hydrogenase nickel incorporation protein HypA/HybF
VHEYSLVAELVERVLAEAAARKALAVHRVSLRVGSLSGVEPELLETAFEMCREGTLCSGARLDVVRVDARWVCASCEVEFPVGAVLTCASCGGVARLVAGGELVLDQIEMEVP